MLYYLYELLNFNFFQYITARAAIGFILGFVFTIYLMPKFILWAKKKNASQPIYELAPQNHQKKSNTPTMGGLVFISSAVIASILCAKLNNAHVIISIITLIFFCIIGFDDDLKKILGAKNHAGMKPKTKMFLLSLSALIISCALFLNGDIGSAIYIPFYKYPIANVGFFIVIFWSLVIVASSNAVNLTDGLDGLATMPSIFSLITLSIFTYLSGNAIFSSYLFLPKIINLGEVMIIASALIGALIGFLWYNCYPAEIFMGDSGSLSIGAFIGLMGVMSKNEFLLLIVCFVFVLEALSVILQVGSFKLFKKRIFLMAPIHHHFEIKGWAENKIIIRFWIIALLSNLIALISIKLR